MAVTASARVQSSDSGTRAGSTNGPARGRSFSFSPRRTLANTWRPIVLVFALLAGWWAVTEAELVAPYILPSPADTWAATQ